MEYLVYILRCGDGSLYTGCTNDLPRRLRAHQSGRGAKYTRSRLPVELIYQEPVADRSAALRREAASSAALRREAAIKRMTHRQKWALAETYRRAAAAGGEETEGCDRHGAAMPVFPAKAPPGRK